MAERIQLPDGTRAVRSVPLSGSGPGVLVAHAWWGLKPFFVDLVDRFAAEGFVTLAPDIFGDGELATTIDDAQARMDSASGAEMAARVRSAHDALMVDPARSGEAIGLVGFSMGAWVGGALAATAEDVAAVVVAYGTDELKNHGTSLAAYQAHVTPADEWEPDEGVDAWVDSLRAAGRPIELHRYPGTKHWFLESDRPEYDAAMAQLFWERTVAFLHDRLDAPD